LVLVGVEADFASEQPRWRTIVRFLAVLAGLRPPHRGKVIRAHALRLGLTPGRSLIPLGFVSDAQYAMILERAACVIMPTLSEGSGSFPVEEALLKGVPVICSDIPILREHAGRLGVEPIWFDPHSPSSLSEQLIYLRDNHIAVKTRAVEQKGSIKRRPWLAVAREYLDIFQRVHASHRKIAARRS
jgi:glycosyltransferase involved in cell wall biosynthesis